MAIKRIYFLPQQKGKSSVWTTDKEEEGEKKKSLGIHIIKESLQKVYT